ncbi:AAA family ATPase [Ralstonia mannitolilytica]|uniref:AAA family ATPase n=1 Tax=Ralstonia mannitolilytica TaxID=105219 RepID=UPI003B842BD4
MRIESVEIKNFRLLADATLALEEQTTVIVGRNNSGKTSLSEVIKRLMTDANASFHLEDFSSASYEGFCQALAAKNAGTGDQMVRELLPAIELRIRFRYSADQADFGPLAPFVVDLDVDCNQALVVIRYELKDGAISAFFEDQPQEALTDESRIAFFRVLRERVPRLFGVTIRAEDPNDATNWRTMPPASLRHLVKTGFINAQRGLDDVTSRETDVLAKVLENMFSTANSEAADEGDHAIAEALTNAVKDVQEQLDQNFSGQLANLLPALESFGYPGLGGQELQTETTLDVKRLLSNFTKVRYGGFSGVTLPEPGTPKLSSQYTSIIEVGGAYAHRFVDLLNFLELRSLIITDLDATLTSGGAACAVHQGTATSNACIKSWFEDDPLTLAVVTAKSDADKCKDRTRIAYQCPEAVDGPCGRTFEDAFILANAAKFGIAGEDSNALELAAQAKAKEFKKSDFALTYAIEDQDWVAPKYLTDGIRWLASDGVSAANVNAEGAPHA